MENRNRSLDSSSRREVPWPAFHLQQFIMLDSDLCLGLLSTGQRVVMEPTAVRCVCIDGNENQQVHHVHCCTSQWKSVLRLLLYYRNSFCCKQFPVVYRHLEPDTAADYRSYRYLDAAHFCMNAGCTKHPVRRKSYAFDSIASFIVHPDSSNNAAKATTTHSRQGELPMDAREIECLELLSVDRAVRLSVCLMLSRVFISQLTLVEKETTRTTTSSGQSMPYASPERSDYRWITRQYSIFEVPDEFLPVLKQRILPETLTSLYIHDAVADTQAAPTQFASPSTYHPPASQYPPHVDVSQTPPSSSTTTTSATDCRDGDESVEHNCTYQVVALRWLPAEKPYSFSHQELNEFTSFPHALPTNELVRVCVDENYVYTYLLKTGEVEVQFLEIDCILSISADGEFVRITSPSLLKERQQKEVKVGLVDAGQMHDASLLYQYKSLPTRLYCWGMRELHLDQIVRKAKLLQDHNQFVQQKRQQYATSQQETAASPLSPLSQQQQQQQQHQSSSFSSSSSNRSASLKLDELQRSWSSAARADTIVNECQVDEVGTFVLYQDGRCKGVFEDRTLVYLDERGKFARAMTREGEMLHAPCEPKLSLQPYIVAVADFYQWNHTPTELKDSFNTSFNQLLQHVVSQTDSNRNFLEFIHRSEHIPIAEQQQQEQEEAEWQSNRHPLQQIHENVQRVLQREPVKRAVSHPTSSGGGGDLKKEYTTMDCERIVAEARQWLETIGHVDE